MPERKHLDITTGASLKHRLETFAQETSRDEGSLVNEAIANFLGAAHDGAQTILDGRALGTHWRVP